MAAFQVMYRRSAGRALGRLADRCHPDVAHFHNFTKHLTIAPVREARRRGIPTVATLHDHWPICPSYTLIQGDGSPCASECARYGVQRCVRHRCVGNSRAASLVAAMEQRFRSALRWNLELFDVVIAPSRFLADQVFSRSGGSYRGVVIRQPSPRRVWSPPPAGTRTRVLYAGRLVPEKGLRQLIEAARGASWDLTVAGVGPLEGFVRSECERASNLRFVGLLKPDEMVRAIQGSDVVAIPSTCVENAPLTMIEALAAGRVIVASRTGGIPEYAEGIDGMCLVPPGDIPALRGAIDELARRTQDLESLGYSCWTASQAAPGWREHVDEILSVYRSVGVRP